MNELFIKGKIIGLAEMLDGREARAYVQREILKQCRESGGAGLVCFTLNAPGPVKVNFLMDVAFYTGAELIEEVLRETTGSTKKFILEHEYGHEAYFPLKENVLEAKKLLTKIEDTHPLGRLFDIDVLRADGTKVSRKEIGCSERTCLICAGPVSACAASRTHSVIELQEKTWGMVYECVRQVNVDATQTNLWHIVISRLAHMSMSLEIATTPKPGLVDFENNGSHKDMDAETFAKSADAISEYFGRCFDAGKCFSDETFASEIRSSCNYDCQKLLTILRPLGLKAEEDMRAATGGVNTHAGLIFSLGIIAAAMGVSTSDKSDERFEIEDVLSFASKIAQPTLSEKESGARLEAAGGFKTLREVALPSLKKALSKGIDINAAGVWTLLKIIAVLDDTNMIKRGGETAAEDARKRASELATEFESAIDSDYPPEMMKACYDLFIDKVKKLDEEFIENNLSPGGAADILALAYFLHLMGELG